MASVTPAHIHRAAGSEVESLEKPARDAGARPSTGTWTTGLTLALLLCRVHADAFRSAPLAYLQGVAWRLRRLRLRSRNRLSALKGRSRHAYALWIQRNEPDVRFADQRAPLSILPIIDCRGNSADPGATLRSLRKAGLSTEPIVIGGHESRGSARVENPSEIARMMTNHRQWLLPLMAGDELAPHALNAYAAFAAEAPLNASLIYADDDLIDQAGHRHSPHFKPDWNPELFEHHDYLSGASILRPEPETLDGLPAEGWIEQIVRSAARRSPPLHLRQMLHHRRSRPLPVIPPKTSAVLITSTPTVTAMIPTRNRHELLRMCVDGLSRTTYPGIATIIIDNDSDESDTRAYLETLKSAGTEVMRIPGPFNYSALNNAAVQGVTSDLLCFLNNDVEMIDPDWLALLVRQAVKKDIGAVGPRLLYPDGTIQHAGVFTGIGGGAGHGHRFQHPDDPGYFNRASLPQRVSAVTGACLVVEREKFLAVGGFDEEQFPVAFNDVDLCLKLNERGWQSFYEPRATLIHHESKSRGSDSLRINRSRFAGELAALKRVWSTDRFRDPYHHPELSPFCEQFLISV